MLLAVNALGVMVATVRVTTTDDHGSSQRPIRTVEIGEAVALPGNRSLVTEKEKHTAGIVTMNECVRTINHVTATKRGLEAIESTGGGRVDRGHRIPGDAMIIANVIETEIGIGIIEDSRGPVVTLGHWKNSLSILLASHERRYSHDDV